MADYGSTTATVPTLDDKLRAPKLSRAERAALPDPGLITLSESKRAELAAFIDGFLENFDSRHSMRLERVETWRTYLAGKNPHPALRTGLSNISVPFMMWVNTAVRQRIVRGINGQRTVVDFEFAGTRGEDNPTTVAAMNKLSEFADRAYRNPRELDGVETIRTVGAELTSIGVGQWKVVVVPPRVRKTPSPDGTVSVRTLDRASVRWVPIRFDDMIYEDGLGTRFDEMLACGHYVRKSWSEIAAWVAQRHYYDWVPEAIRTFYTKDSSKVAQHDPPEVLAPHRIAELAFDWDIDDDGWLESIVVDWHREARCLMRVAYSQFDGARPYVAVQFDEASVVGAYQGQGVPEKLEDAQAEMNAVHNTGIEAGKRGILPITIGRRGTALDSQIGATGQVMPGEHYSSDAPVEDLEVKFLGEPRAVEYAVMQEANTRQYATRLLGRDEAGLGDVSSAKRVPGGLGGAIMSEGRVPIEDPLGSLASGVQRAFYLTLTAWQRHVPTPQLRAALDDETLATLESLVFSPEVDVRDRLRIVVRAQDIASTEEAKRQGLLVLNNFLLGHFDRVATTLQTLMQIALNPQLPPEFKAVATDVTMMLLERMQKSVEILLTTMDEVDDPRDLLLPLAEIQRQIDSLGFASPLAAAAPGAGGESATPPLPSAAAVDSSPVEAAMGGMM